LIDLYLSILGTLGYGIVTLEGGFNFEDSLCYLLISVYNGLFSELLKYFWLIISFLGFKEKLLLNELCQDIFFKFRGKRHDSGHSLCRQKLAMFMYRK